MTPQVPHEYAQYIAAHGVFEGFTIGDDIPAYVILWALAEIPGINADIEIREHAPGYVAFATDGNGEVLAFDDSGAVYTLPLIGMSPYCAVKVADSFGELADRFELRA